MSGKFLNILCAAIIGLIIVVGFVLFNHAGQNISMEKAILTALICAAAVYVALIPNCWARIKHLFCDYDWAEETADFYHKIPDKYRHSFWCLFGLINLAFLFHTMHFMWGNQDWAAVRYAVDGAESLQTGAFSKYWLQELIFDGKILPVANNLWSFAGLSLAGILLAIYWNLPQKSSLIVTSGLIFTVTPYTLAVMYYAKATLAFCFLPAMVLTALLLSQKQSDTALKTYINNLISIFLFIWALGTYMPVINFALIAIIGQIFLKTVYADVKLKDAAQRTCQGIANLTAAAMIYLLILLILKETNQLNAEDAIAVNLIAPLQRIPLWIKYSFLQFGLPLPFMDIAYKVIYLLLALISLYTLIFNAPSAHAAARGLALIPLLILASLISVIFCANLDEHFLRMSFFGLPLLYTLLFVSIINLGNKHLVKIGYILAVLLIFMNFVRIAYAEKVWKFGWDAETKLAERIITRLEKMPEFDISRQYQLIQIGEKSLRAKYYQKSPLEKIISQELLSAAYYPAGAAKEAYNFFYQTDFLKGDAKADALQNPTVKDYLLNHARAWPAKESLFITGDYIIFILDEADLIRTQRYLSRQ